MYNATGPTTTLGEVLETSKRVARSTAMVRPVPLDVLRANAVADWMGPKSMPLWIDDPEWRYFATLDTRRARAAGLVTRPLDETLADTLAYEEARDVPRGAGLTDDDERELRLGLR